MTKPTIHVERSGANIILKWLEGTLQTSVNVQGTYTDVLTGGNPVTAPYTNAMTGGARFYRLRE